MKKILGLCTTICLIAHIATAQNIAKIDSGKIQGAGFRIVFPANFNNKLVMYAHGYEFMGSQPLQSKNPDWVKRMQPFLQRGFAVAASDYRHQGLALATGVDDTEALRAYYVQKFGQPDSAFMVGHSMGGGIAIATMENFGKNYNGALPLCPLSGRIYLQTRKEFDLIAVFNALFPGYLPSLSTILDKNQTGGAVNMQQAFGKAMQLRKEIFAKDSLTAADIARRFDLKPEDLPFSLAFGENVLRDVAVKAGGNAYDNTNTVYGGFRNNLLVNQKVERLAATVGQDIFLKYDRTGEIDKPTLALHTIYDQLIPAEMAIVRYENLIQQRGKQQYFTVKYTDGQGHCNFTPAQTGKAFDELRTWAKTGVKAKAGQIE